MNGRNKGIALCMVVLAVLLGMLVYRGIGHVRDNESEFATEAVLTTPVTQSAAGTAVSEKAVTAAASVVRDDETETEQNPAEISQKEAEVKPAQTASPSPTQNPKRSAVPTSKPKPEKKKRSSSDEKGSVPGVTASPSAAPVQTGVPASTATTAEEKREQVSLNIQCTRILGHEELWKDGIASIIPEQGIFFTGECEIAEGDTVYDVLKRVCEERGIALDSQYTPIYGTYYIRGIGNLYEFDCGSESGWKYSVNGITPNIGCSSYALSDGDQIIFYYDINV